MAVTLYKEVSYTLSYLLQDIEKGDLALPDLQRPFVWATAKIRELLDSMYRGYPIGSLMFWETGAEVGSHQIDGGEDRNVPSMVIVDGQQRLTSLYAVIKGRPILTKTFEEKKVRIAFSPTKEAFEVTDIAIERDPEFIADVTSIWSGSLLSAIKKYLERLEASRGEPLDQAEQDAIGERIQRVQELGNFTFHVVVLNADTDEEQVAEIFVRVNSEGVSLNQADFILTLLSVHWEDGRKDLEAFCRSAVDSAHKGASPKNPFIDPGADQLLRVTVALAFRRARLRNVYNILRGKDLETGEFSPTLRDEQLSKLAAAQRKALDLVSWHEFLKCLQVAGFRSKKMISSDTALLYSYALWLIGRHDFGLDYKPLRQAIARWFFMTHTMGRYTSSPETQFEADLGRISDLPAGDGPAFLRELDRIINSNFTNDYWTISLPSRLDTSSPRSPALFAYLAALNLMDADVLFSEVKVRDLLDPAVTAKKGIERHHLFPKKYLAKLNIAGTRQANAIANMAFLDWSENSAISDEAPSTYWPIMKDSVTAGRLVRQAEHHALPVGWEQLDYPAFLERRRILIAEVIKKGFKALSQDPNGNVESTESILAGGESQTVEFKSTLRWNLRAQTVDSVIEHAIVKTICGFMNAEGGTLFIGVDDDGKVLGLNEDVKTLGSKASLDGFELHLRQVLNAALSIPTAGIVTISFERLGDLDIAIVRAAPSGNPVFAKPAKSSGSPSSEFWVRVGNATHLLHGADMIHYQSEHWG